MDTERNVYLGIDISNKYTLLSCYRLDMEEPVTISTTLGTENYLVPTFVAKRRGMGMWYFGEEAKKAVNIMEATGVENVYNLAMQKERVHIEDTEYSARELLVIYFKRFFAAVNIDLSQVKKLCVTVSTVTMETMELFSYVANMLGLENKRLMLIDYKESFYYYALSQNPALYVSDVSLFDYCSQNLIHLNLSRNQRTKPQLITIDTTNYGDISDMKSSRFRSISEQVMTEKRCSSVYLLGESFEGDWIQESLSILCKGRKVFQGRNLYSRGACYGAAVKSNDVEWPFIYMGDNELKLNLSIKVSDLNEMKFISLIEAGDSWYEAKGECEILLDGTDGVLDFWVQRPESRDAHLEELELTDLPKRANRTTRLRISALPVSDKKIAITILDLGFGEIVPASGRRWEHTISLEE